MDLAEQEGLSRVLGSELPIVATKAIWGETFGAAAVLSLCASLAWLGKGPSDAECAAPILRGALTREVRTVLVTAMGYYGNVSAMIVSKRAQPRASGNGKGNTP
jgi:3-oxoacyl-(acyl-carrier-protein) synthase